VPDDVEVTAQVMAQPDPNLPERVIAALADGTPLVTRKAVGQGQVVLVHVTANAEWSTLPLSGLFVQMLERLAVGSLTLHDEIAGSPEHRVHLELVALARVQGNHRGEVGALRQVHAEDALPPGER